AGTVLVLHRPELSAGILGRLPVSQGLSGPAEALSLGLVAQLRRSRIYRDRRSRRILSQSLTEIILIGRGTPRRPSCALHTPPPPRLSLRRKTARQFDRKVRTASIYLSQGL